MPREVVEVLQNAVLEPDFVSAFWTFLAFFVGEFVPIFPSTIVLTGQAVFIEEIITTQLVLKLIFLVSLPVGLGTTLGSLPQYAIAYWGGKPAIDRFQRYLRFSWKDVERMESQFKDKWYDEFIFLFFRSLPLLPSAPVNIVAGILRMNLPIYVMLTIIGTTIRTMLMITLIYLGAQGLF